MDFKAGLVGCGRISDIYLQTLADIRGIEVVACSSRASDKRKIENGLRHGKWIPVEDLQGTWRVGMGSGKL